MFIFRWIDPKVAKDIFAAASQPGVDAAAKSFGASLR